MRPIRLGVSACLLGEEVRYDAGHKRDSFLCETLGRFVEWVPVCPEVDIGLGVPREPIRLIAGSSGTRLVATRSGTDLTDTMPRYGRRKVKDLAAADLCGYVLKKDSPSCGMERVKVHAGTGPSVRSGVGLFAQALQEAFPSLPIEEEGRLNDSALRENFIERVFAYRRWRDFLADKTTLGALVEYHADHKLLLMAHSPAHYTRLGRIVAGGKSMTKARLHETYGAQLMDALAIPATARKNANVLYHVLGYFKKVLTAAEKQEMIETIQSYSTGLVPLIVPITLLSHYVRKYDQPYLARQVYLSPHPRELMLRNHV
ncbi:MAG TPA: DUF523 and DUF1722 domain-containing protein [Candidatus Polarisedimenticolia bacterium]|nr:DUF523 and DUF1722 domain-containing protein [Candidatus Polarisedimenticolia bacterium]